ncbi:MAG: hypothetical protein AAFY71_07900 [Bacteroidota bacterium]
MKNQYIILNQHLLALNKISYVSPVIYGPGNGEIASFKMIIDGNEILFQGKYPDMIADRQTVLAYLPEKLEMI